MMTTKILFGSHVIAFDLSYSKRKTLGVKVMPDASVHVAAPMDISLDKIKEVVLKKAMWILKQKSYFLNFEATNIKYEIKSGYSIHYLGRQYKIVVEQTTKNEVAYKGNLFLISVKNKKDAKLIFDRWLKERAMTKIIEIAHPMIKKFSLSFQPPSDIFFQEMPTRWGSCTIKNKLILNPKLIHTPKRCIEYVVMHELCHLIHKHHNQEFFKLLTLMMPDWEKRKEKLDSFTISE